MKKVFISHITEEKEIALHIKNTLDSFFKESLSVFVSSDFNCIQIGETWLEKINSNLRNMDGMIVLCSPDSYKRSWINFEAGFALGKGVPCIVLCIDEMSPEKLGLPLNQIQVLKMGEFNYLQLFLILYEKLNLSKGLELSIENYTEQNKKINSLIFRHFCLSRLNQFNLCLVKVIFESNQISGFIQVFKEFPNFEDLENPKIYVSFKENLIPSLKQCYLEKNVSDYITFEETIGSEINQNGTFKKCIIGFTKISFEVLKQTIDYIAKEGG